VSREAVINYMLGNKMLDTLTPSFFDFAVKETPVAPMPGPESPSPLAGEG
jgi:hypothetical protein